MSACLAVLFGQSSVTRSTPTDSSSVNGSKSIPRSPCFLQPFVCAMLVASLLVGLSGRAIGSESSHYQKKETWHETMISAREALVERERSQPEQVRLRTFTSEVVHGGKPAIRIAFPLSA